MIASSGPELDRDRKFEYTVMRALEPLKEKTTTKPQDMDEASTRFRVNLASCYIFSNIMVYMFVLSESLKSFTFLGDSYWHKI